MYVCYFDPTISLVRLVHDDGVVVFLQDLGQLTKRCAGSDLHTHTALRLAVSHPQHSHPQHVSCAAYLVELGVGDRGDEVRGLGLPPDHLGREVRQSHHPQDITAVKQNTASCTL